MQKSRLVYIILILVFTFSIANADAQTVIGQERSEITSAQNKTSARQLFFSLPLKPLIQESPRPPARQFKDIIGTPGAPALRAAKSERKLPTPPAPIDNVGISPDDTGTAPPKKETEAGFQWGPALRQSLLFLAIQHGYAFTQPKTRRALKGEFWKDYFDSVKSLHGWADGGRFFTNYIAHPMQGSFTGFIQVQNDPVGRRLKFGASKSYWQSRMKAMAWSAALSAQFEVGPISQASIGNVGLYGKQTFVDLVVTPTIGTAWLITEDAVDRVVISWAERQTRNAFVRIAARMILNPTRSCANLLRFKKPWYRDR